jgi:hypothetical protein
LGALFWGPTRRSLIIHGPHQHPPIWQRKDYKPTADMIMVLLSPKHFLTTLADT